MERGRWRGGGGEGEGGGVFGGGSVIIQGYEYGELWKWEEFEVYSMRLLWTLDILKGLPML